MLAVRVKAQRDLVDAALRLAGQIAGRFGTERGGNALEGSRLVATTEEPKSSLAEADDGVELGVVGELADVADLEARQQPVRAGGVSGQADEVVR